MLELALFALDLGALAARVVPSADSSTWWWSGLAAAIGFFVGGLVAGASHPSRQADDGVLNGIGVWAVTVVSLLVMSAIGAGIGFGVVGDVLATSSSLGDADASTISDAQNAAAGALLALTVTLARSGDRWRPGVEDVAARAGQHHRPAPLSRSQHATEIEERPMVTPEEIARAMAVNSNEDEQRSSTEAGPAEVMIDDEPVQVEER